MEGFCRQREGGTRKSTLFQEGHLPLGEGGAGVGAHQTDDLTSADQGILDLLA